MGGYQPEGPKDDPEEEMSISGRDGRSLLETDNRVSEVLMGATIPPDLERGGGHNPKRIRPSENFQFKFPTLVILFLLITVIMLLVFPPFCESKITKPDPCKSCVKTVRTGNTIGETLIYQSRYACQGKKTQCTFKNITYSLCQKGQNYVCYDPKENPVQWYLQAYQAQAGSTSFAKIKIQSPTSRVTITLEPCGLFERPTDCGGLDWQRTYVQDDKYICPEKGIGDARCNHQCFYWSCVGWATWQTRGPGATLVKVPVQTNCKEFQCNYVNFTINNPQTFLSKFGNQFGIRIRGKGSDPLGSFTLKLVKYTEEGHSISQSFFTEFWEEMKIPFEIPEVAKNLFVTFAETIASTLNISNCYVCGGTQVGDQWPWEAAELNVSEPYNAINTPQPHSQWMLKNAIVSRWCINRINPRAPTIGRLACETMTILNETDPLNFIYGWWPKVNMIPINQLWDEFLKLRLNLSLPNSSAWDAPKGLYWICGRYAYSQLPEPWDGACTLGEIRPSFFLIPLRDGETLGHPIYSRKKRAPPIGNWKDEEWPPERIVQYYGPATWAADGAYGYRTPIYMLNRIIRLQAVLEIITNETARALNTLSKTQIQLRNAVYQNRLALDYLLAAEGGVCGKFNLTNCCLNIDENGKVIEEITSKMVKLAHVPVQTWKGFEWAEGLGSWFSWFGGLRGLIAAVAVCLLLCFIIPCILPLLVDSVRGMMERIADKRAADQIMVLQERYRPVLEHDSDIP